MDCKGRGFCRLDKGTFVQKMLCVIGGNQERVLCSKSFKMFPCHGDSRSPQIMRHFGNRNPQVPIPAISHFRPYFRHPLLCPLHKVLPCLLPFGNFEDFEPCPSFYTQEYYALKYIYARWILAESKRLDELGLSFPKAGIKTEILDS